MSLDKPSSGDRPDHAHEPEHKPFPGAPENRPQVPPPTGARTFDEIRAARARQAASADRDAAEAAERTVPRAPSKDAVIAGPGTADTGGRGTSFTPALSRTSAVPDGTPGRSDGDARRTAAPPERGHATRPDATGSQRPGALVHPERGQLRHFPGAPDSRQPVPPPAGVRTFDEIRADRSTYKSTSEYAAARNAEKAPGQQAAAKEIPVTAKESAAARPAAGATAERAVRARDQGRGGSDQPKKTAEPIHESSVPLGEARAAQAPKRGPGDKHPDPAAQPDKTTQADNDTSKTQVPGVPSPPGSAGPLHNPDSSAAQRSGKGGILHGHSEFHGHSLDVYTDGVRWVGGDAVRAAQAEAARARAEGQQAPRRYSITDVPQMRDLGRNTVGEKEDRSPGDTSDLPPTGAELVETAGKDKPRLERLKNEAFQEFDGVVGGVKEVADAILNAMSRPQPSGHPEVPVRDGPVIGPQEGHHIAPGADSVTQAILVGGVVGYQAVRWADHKIAELRRRHDAGHG